MIENPEVLNKSVGYVIKPLTMLVEIKMPVIAVLLLGAISLAAVAVSMAVVGYSIAGVIKYILNE